MTTATLSSNSFESTNMPTIQAGANKVSLLRVIG